MQTIWAGIDSGKRAHHCVVIDHAGTVLLSQRVENDEAELLELIAAVTELAVDGEVCWATDLNAGGAALLIALLTAHGQRVLYIPGRIVHHAAATYRGDGKTDAKDAKIIADQARMRTDLQPVRGADQVAVDVRLLTSHRLDVIHDRVRAINRLRATLLEYFPALERTFDYSRTRPRSLSSPLYDSRQPSQSRRHPTRDMVEGARLSQQREGRPGRRRCCARATHCSRQKRSAPPS